MILSGDNKIVELISLSSIGLRVIVFEMVSWINRLSKNKIVLEIAWMEAICRVMWQVTYLRYFNRLPSRMQA